MKHEVFIVLPGGVEYKVWQKDPTRNWTKDEFDEEVQNYRRLLGDCANINISVTNKLGEKEVLILWGEVLQNTYLRARLIE